MLNHPSIGCDVIMYGMAYGPFIEFGSVMLHVASDPVGRVVVEKFAAGVHDPPS